MRVVCDHICCTRTHRHIHVMWPEDCLACAVLTEADELTRRTALLDERDHILGPLPEDLA